jgi:hypothetical protein
VTLYIIAPIIFLATMILICDIVVGRAQNRVIAVGIINNVTDSTSIAVSTTIECQQPSRINNASSLEKTDCEEIQCTICIDHKKNCVLDPCGHTFCSDCTNRFKQQNCPICSKPFSKALPIFI